MIAAAEPRADRRAQRLMRVDVARGTLADGRVASLSEHARPGDVWVLNDAATLPASLAGRAGGRSVELRLAGERADGSWRAVLFGEGSWRDDTDARPAPPVLAPGETIDLGGALAARVIEVDDRSPRLLTVRFEPGGDAFWRALYALGRPVQYSYVGRPLRLSEVQTGFAGRPWAVELPSAGRPLDAGLLLQLRRRGAEVTSLTHAAGLSATGDPDLDARLPLPERYDVPERTADAIRRALAEGRRVVAVGTSVTRALEGAFALHGEVPAGPGETGLVIGPRTPLRVVDALLTGAHDPQSSHYQLLRAFAPDTLLARAVERSTALGYLGHELGDSWLIA
ncbi:MAG: S-adenosylmethionine:tRNA ribosyltransferase-isomerase [Myxococcota bacterium]|nr:S-adenosylmethionine:tRNA ribosyltransferase-isomerase [Myxococcota bacterium]